MFPSRVSLVLLMSVSATAAAFGAGANCKASLPQPIAVTFETDSGTGFWPPSYAPFIADDPCDQDQDDRGYHYRKATYSGSRTYLSNFGYYTFETADFAMNWDKDGDLHSRGKWHHEKDIPGEFSENETNDSTTIIDVGEDWEAPPPVEKTKKTKSQSRSWTEIDDISHNDVHHDMKQKASLDEAIPLSVKSPVRMPPPGSPFAFGGEGKPTQTTTAVGYITTCPGKYEITLYYTETSYDCPTAFPTRKKKHSETKEFKEEDRTSNGFEVRMPLPTAEGILTEFERLEYRALTGGCSSNGSANGPGGDDGLGGSIVSITHLGHLADGSDAGSLYLHANNVNEEAFSPAALVYLSGADDTQVSIVRDTNHAIRQILVPDALVDITGLTSGSHPSGYQIAFYPHPAASVTPDSITGLYSVSGTVPYVRYENPDAPGVLLAAATRLRVTRQYASGDPQIKIYEKGSGNSLSLIEGGGLRRTVKTVTTSGADTTKREDSYGPASATVPEAVKWTITRQYSFGPAVLEESRGTGTSRVWTTYAYDETPTSAYYGLRLSRQSSDGAWERYEYNPDRTLHYTFSPLRDAAVSESDPTLLKCTETRRVHLSSSSYGSGDLFTQIETHGGAEVRRTHRFVRDTRPSITLTGEFISTAKHVVETRATLPGGSVAWDDTTNQMTHRFEYEYGELDGQPMLEVDAQGGATFYKYPRFDGVAPERTTSVWRGTANAPVTPSSTPTGLDAGTLTTTVTTSAGHLLSEDIKDIVSGLTVDSRTYADHDSTGRPLTVLHLDGSAETSTYSPCCGQLSSVSRHGMTTTYGFDALGRREWERTQAGIVPLSEIRYTYDSADRVLTRSRVPFTGSVAGTPQLVERNTYDDAGTLLSTATPGSVLIDTTLTRVTTYATAYNSTTGRTTRTTTRPDGATEITLTDRAGRLLARTGTAIASVRYEYGTATLADAAQWHAALAGAAPWGLSTSTPVPYTREIKLTASGADSAEIVTTYSDFLGNTVKTLYADGAIARSFYDSAGRLVRQSDPDGVQTLFAYTHTAAGEVRTTALDINRDGAIDLAGPDRVSRSTRLIATVVDSSVTYPVERTTTEGWLADGSAAATTLAISETSSDGLRAWQTSYGLITKTVTAYNDTTGERTDTTTHPDATSTVNLTLRDRALSQTRKDSAGATVTQATTAYDALGRPATQTLVGIGATTTVYFADDHPYTVTTPDPDSTRSGPGYDSQTTTYAYDAAGRVVTITEPDGTQAFTTYWSTGQVKRTWGSRTYPSEYSYDAAGRVKTLTTWQNFAADSGAAVTTWNYSSTRGWLSSKRYTDGTGPDYDYWPSGRLKTRDWARSVSGTRLRTSYAYNNAGDLETIDYADATPDVTQTYDRLGRSLTTTDAAGALTRTYENGRIDDETYATASGSLNLLAGLAIARTQGDYHRPATLVATDLDSLAYGYDAAGRLATLAQDTRVATLGYKAQAGTHQSTAIAISGTARAATTRTTDNLGRISRVDTTTGSTLHARRDYTYNAANQRSEVVHEDALRWAYGYDALGQVTTAQKRSASAALLPGYDHAYSYDTIGNRVSTTTNGRLATYTPDLRNQYVSRTVPAAFDVLGAAATDVNVLVGGEVPSRLRENFQRAVPVTNASAPAFQSVTILAARPGTSDQVATETRSAFVAQTPEAFTYDLDGNLTQDGRWTYVWDAENRLVEMATRADVAASLPALPRQKLVFSYDTQGRRVLKRILLWDTFTSTFILNSETKFLYDGWNLLAEYNGLAANALVRSHAWGLDLSGSAQGAGGVGGLLWTTVPSGSSLPAPGSYAPGWDANGNIVAWIDLSTGTVTGRRDYGAFGETVAATGNATSIPFAFSTKFRDSETELYYYGFRYYYPSAGRWISRDPIKEEGGVNIYNFVDNSGLHYIDPLGLVALSVKKNYGQTFVTASIDFDEETIDGVHYLVMRYDVGIDWGRGGGKSGKWHPTKETEISLSWQASFGAVGTHTKGEARLKLGKGCCFKFEGEVLDVTAGLYGSASGQAKVTHGDPDKFGGWELTLGVSGSASVATHVPIYLIWNECVDPSIRKAKAGIGANTSFSFNILGWEKEFSYGDPTKIYWSSFVDL